MDILVYEDNIEKDCMTVAIIDWKKFEQKVKIRPEDYIFILSSDEINKFIELNRQIAAGLQGEKININEEEYIHTYPGVFIIVDLSLQRDFVKRYKVGFFTNQVLGTSYAVFYISRSMDDVERQNEVLRRIKSFKAVIREDNKRN